MFGNGAAVAAVIAVASLSSASSSLSIVSRSKKSREIVSVYSKGTPPVKKSSSSSGSGKYSNPVMENLADPGCIRVGKTYYVSGTQRGGFDIFSSENLRDWKQVGNTGPLGVSQPWAPDFMFYGGKYYLAYTDGGDFTSSIAIADRVTGPYRVILSHGIPGIDASLYAHTDGRVYAFYNPIKRGAIMACCRLSKDLSRMEESRDLFSGPVPGLNQREVTVEAPFVVRAGGTLYMLFSANATGPNYNLSYATASSPFGPWKQSGKVLLPDDKTGHGHASLVQTPKGTWVVVYHGAAGQRNLCVNSVTIGSGQMKINYTPPGVKTNLIT